MVKATAASGRYVFGTCSEVGLSATRLFHSSQFEEPNLNASRNTDIVLVLFAAYQKRLSIWVVARISVNGKTEHNGIILLSNWDYFDLATTSQLRPLILFLRPNLPRLLRRRLTLTVLLNHHFHPSPLLLRHRLFILLLHLLLPTSSSSSTVPTSAVVASALHHNATHNPDTPTNTNTTFAGARGEDLDYTCPHSDRSFTSDIGLNAQSHVKPIRFPTVSYDDLTKPEGSWQESYDRMNNEYSRYMYYGIATFLVSTAITIYCADFGRYAEPFRRNTPEGLSFLNPKPEILEEILN
ncbi:hypothetical protein SprV_0100085000 [Sparganum proliferum]